MSKKIVIIGAVIYFIGVNCFFAPFSWAEKEQKINIDSVTYFSKKMYQQFVNEIGKPIEGMTPRMHMAVWPGLVAGDFNGVEAKNGVYITDQNNKAIFKGKKIYSASDVITPTGIKKNAYKYF